MICVTVRSLVTPKLPFCKNKASIVCGPTSKIVEPLLPIGLLMVTALKLSAVNAGSITVTIAPLVGSERSCGKREPCVLRVAAKPVNCIRPVTVSAFVPLMVPPNIVRLLIVAGVLRLITPPKPTLTSSAGPGTLPQLHVPASVQLPVVLFGQVQVAVGRAVTRDENANNPTNAANINSAPYSTVRFKDMLPPLEVGL